MMKQNVPYHEGGGRKRRSGEGGREGRRVHLCNALIYRQ